MLVISAQQNVHRTPADNNPMVPNEIAMDHLNWLNRHHLTAVARREYGWVFSFSGGVALVVTCLWRLTEDGRIRLTSSDDGHRFGLPAPVDAQRRLNESLANAKVIAVDLRDGALDLRLTLDNGRTIEIIPDSSGYEAWTVQRSDQMFVAVGGGSLAVLNGYGANHA